MEINTDSRTLRPVAKLREPRDPLANLRDSATDGPAAGPRWPAECQVGVQVQGKVPRAQGEGGGGVGRDDVKTCCRGALQVLEERVQHIEVAPASPEAYYVPTGREVQPQPVGEEVGQVVFQYYPVSAVNYVSLAPHRPHVVAAALMLTPPFPWSQFSRSSVGGSRILTPAWPPDLRPDDLRFESRFESGNLAKVVRITETYYELYLRTDLYTNRHMQWFYFRVENMRRRAVYRFSIVNLSKVGGWAVRAVRRGAGPGHATS